MKDERTLSYINFFAILGAISELLRLDPKAREIVGDTNLTLGVSVKNGPVGRLAFANGTCTVLPARALARSSCRFFLPKVQWHDRWYCHTDPLEGIYENRLPLKKFIPLTDLLTKYLRPSEEDLKDEGFFRISTLLTFYVVTEALSQIGNEDKIGRASASYVVDGTVKIAIGDEIAASITAKDHVLTTTHATPETFLSYMIFQDVPLANDLFAGRINSVATVGTGKIRIGGMISQVDNLNRILDRVALYLA